VRQKLAEDKFDPFAPGCPRAKVACFSSAEFAEFKRAVAASEVQLVIVCLYTVAPLARARAHAPAGGNAHPRGR
jgi:hypothetical protein